MIIYILNSENLTQLGGPMGTEYTFSNWKEYYVDLEKAKKSKKITEKFIWKRRGKGCYTSGDLGYVKYNITPIKVIE